MWWIIIFIAGIILIAFRRDTSQEGKRIDREGGMRTKYSILINYLLGGDSRSKIYRQDALSLLLGLRVPGSSTMFELVQTYGNITVRYKFTSNIFGEHTLEWDFEENMNQEKMYERICLDIQEQNKRLEIN